MMITKKHLSRRTVLRGLGVTLALPLLDSMVPAFASAQTPVRRLAAIYAPNGMNMTDWTLPGTGAFEFPTILRPLTPFRDKVVVVNGLDLRCADQIPGEGVGDHSRSSAAYLTGMHAKKTEGADIRNGVSMDQIAAKELGQQTQLASLELALEANDLIGGCENGYSCAYTGTIAWASDKTPLPMENDPRAVFEALFGATDSTDRSARLARTRAEKSILDTITDRLGSFQYGLGAGDRLKIGEYVEAVRDVERRIQLAEQQNSRELPTVAQPGGVPGTYEEHAKLMLDLWTLAWQTDLTRVTTFMFGREKSGRSYPEIGVPDPHHPLSHHQNRPDMLAKLTKLNTFHMSLFAHFLEKLRTTTDGDSSLLDQAVILYGSGMSNPDQHLHSDLPILVVGGGGGSLKGGRQIQAAAGTPLANLHLAMLDKMGIRIDRLGDSNSTSLTL